jgi:hypothetical protein
LFFDVRASNRIGPTIPKPWFLLATHSCPENFHNRKFFSFFSQAPALTGGEMALGMLLPACRCGCLSIQTVAQHCRHYTTRQCARRAMVVGLRTAPGAHVGTVGKDMGCTFSFFSVRYLDNDINTFEKSGGQFEVFCISVQFVLEGNCLLPCFCSLATVAWTFLQKMFCSHRCCATCTQVGFIDLLVIWVELIFSFFFWDMNHFRFLPHLWDYSSLPTGVH